MYAGGTWWAEQRQRSRCIGQLLSTESRNTLNSQLSVYPAGQSKPNSMLFIQCLRAGVNKRGGGLIFEGFVWVLDSATKPLLSKAKHHLHITAGGNSEEGSCSL